MQDSRPRLVQAHISNFMGIEELTVTVPPAGAVVAGRNSSGKTSVLRAIQAALEGRGVDPSAIRKGAKRACIELNMGHFTVRRLISTAKNGGTLTVEHPGAMVQRAPQTYLRELLGATLDPLRFWEEKDLGEQRKMLLAAIPAPVSPAMLCNWVPGGLSMQWLAGVLGVDQARTEGAGHHEPFTEHGLDVIAKVRKACYTARTDANAKRDLRVADLRRAEAELEEMTLELGRDFGEPSGCAVFPDEPAAAVALEERRAERRAALESGRAADRWEKSASATQKKIDALRAQIAEKRQSARLATHQTVVDVAREYLARAREIKDAADAECVRLEQLLRAARDAQATADIELRDAGGALDVLDAQHDAATADQEAIVALEEQASDLEAAIGETPARPSEEEVARLDAAVTAAEAQIVKARRGRTIVEKGASVEEVREDAERFRARAKRLDDMVDIFTHTAPAALLGASNTIPGLSVIDDDIVLDGVSLSRLAGAESLRFAVDLARRLAKAPILLVDGLETVDPEHINDFIAWATRDGFQLIATRVEAGDREIQPIEGGP